MRRDKDLFNQLEAAIGKESLATTFDSLPRSISLMSACTGSGVFELVAESVANYMNANYVSKSAPKFQVQLSVETFLGHEIDIDDVDSDLDDLLSMIHSNS